MRTTILALTSSLALLSGGCAGTKSAVITPQGDPKPTPVARAVPSISHRIISKNLRDSREVADNTSVEGALVR